MKMQKLLFVILVIVACSTVLAERNAERNTAKRVRGPAGKKAVAKDCSPWTHETCVLKNSNATCGFGKKVGTRTGDNCPVKEKEFKCRIKCPPTMASGCKYRKGKWSACDPVTKSITRTLTLKKGNAETCEATKTVTRKCKGEGRVPGASGATTVVNAQPARRNKNKNKPTPA